MDRLEPIYSSQFSHQRPQGNALFTVALTVCIAALVGVGYGAYVVYQQYIQAIPLKTIDIADELANDLSLVKASPGSDSDGAPQPGSDTSASVGQENVLDSDYEQIIIQAAQSNPDDVAVVENGQQDD